MGRRPVKLELSEELEGTAAREEVRERRCEMTAGAATCRASGATEGSR